MSGPYREAQAKDSVVLYEDFAILRNRVAEIESRREDSDDVKQARVWGSVIAIVLLALMGSVLGGTMYGDHCAVAKAAIARDQAAIERDTAHEQAMRAMWDKQPYDVQPSRNERESR